MTDSTFNAARTLTAEETAAFNDVINTLRWLMFPLNMTVGLYCFPLKDEAGEQARTAALFTLCAKGLLTAERLQSGDPAVRLTDYGLAVAAELIGR